MLKVLIVEDDVRVAQVNSSFVQQVPGFQVVAIAPSAAEAERALLAHEPDLVILDLYLPDGHGLDLLHRLRGGAHTADVIIVTAAKEAATLQQALRAGAVDYILKPYRFERFAEALTRYRAKRQELAAATELEQANVDRLLGRASTGPELPKGIDPITLERVIAGLEGAEKGRTAEEFGASTGLSRTTARRYLEYLVGIGKATVQAVYGDVGRPERLYHKAGRR
jgi:two-component system CitB family response regulator